MTTSLAPPPTNTASGAGSPPSASGARPVTTRRRGTPRRAALRTIRSARSGSASTATASVAGCERSHSIATDPAPAPMSHSRAPGRGASRARALARRSRLVSWPSCSKASSGSPGAQEVVAVGRPTRARASTWRRGSSSVHGSSAVPSIRDSSGEPRSPRTVIRLDDKPSSRSIFATMAGVLSSDDRTSSRRPGASSRRSTSTSRPTRVTTSDRLRRPPHPGPGQRDRRDRGQDLDVVPDQLGQGGADPGEERIPGRERDQRAVAVLLQQGGQPGERARPRPSLLAGDRRHQTEVAFPAEEHLRREHLPAGDVAQPGPAVRADPHDRDPSRSLGPTAASTPHLPRRPGSTRRR